MSPPSHPRNPKNNQSTHSRDQTLRHRDAPPRAQERPASPRGSCPPPCDPATTGKSAPGWPPAAEAPLRPQQAASVRQHILRRLRGPRASQGQLAPIAQEIFRIRYSYASTDSKATLPGRAVPSPRVTFRLLGNLASSHLTPRSISPVRFSLGGPRHARHGPRCRHWTPTRGTRPDRRR